MRHALIMAGGAGTRLWSLSRKERPKQVLPIFGGTSLLRQAYERLAVILPPEMINVITNQVHIPQVAKELPEIPAANLIGEPVGRDTVNAIGLGAAILAQRDPDATMGVFTADHVITPMERFADAVNTAFDTAESYPNALITIGIRPTSPHTGYGYVHRAQRVEHGVYHVKNFTEKPDLESATEYFDSGEYYWNSGMFAWRTEAILSELKRHLPHSYESFREIADNWNTDERTQKLQLLYPTLMKISVDFAVMERAGEVLVVEMDCKWVDVGAWNAMEVLHEPDEAGNVSVCKNSVHLGSKGNIVVCEDDHLIATIGVENLVIVHAQDATLICNKRDSQGIKELVDIIRKEYGQRYV